MKFDDKNFIAEKVKYYRKKMKLTQAELAEKVNLSDQHISRIESGCYVPSLKTFFLLASILKMDLQEFGFDVQATQNELKNKLISTILNANDNQLIFYDNIINAVNISMKSYK